MSDHDWPAFQSNLLQLEHEGLATRTFRRLDAQRQQAVLQAILDETAEHGPSGASIKRVAARAGVSVGSLYQYFGSRDRMLDFAIQLSVRSALAAFAEYTPLLAALPLREALLAYLQGGLEWGRLQAGLLRLFARAAYHGDPSLTEPLVRPIAAQLQAMVGEILLAAANRGELRPDVNLAAATRIVNSLLIVAGDAILLPYLNHYFQFIGPDATPDQAIAATVDFVVQGMIRQREAGSP